MKKSYKELLKMHGFRDLDKTTMYLTYDVEGKKWEIFIYIEDNLEIEVRVDDELYDVLIFDFIQTDEIFKEIIKYKKD